MLKFLKDILSDFDLFLPEEKLDDLFEQLQKKYPTGEDPWGLNLKKARTNLEYLWPWYKHYFKVRVFGTENIEDTPYVVASNHSGQIAIDGMLISTAFVTETNPPRILRPMVERFVNTIPFFGSWAAEGGAVLGDRQNCLSLLNKGQSVLVFPEGVKGVAKSTPEYYQLQNFTKGFFRMALKAKTPVLPIAVIGAEEFYPYVYQARGLAKALNLPALPITPHLFPLPSPVDIYIGKPISLPDLSSETFDKTIDQHVLKVEDEIKKMIEVGLKKRREFWGNVEKNEETSDE